MKLNRRMAPDGERGSVMVVAMMMLVLVTAMGLAYVSLSKTETGIAGSEKRHVQSIYSAEAGVSEAMARMSSSDSVAYFGQPAGSTPTPGWGRYLVQANNGSNQDPNVGATLSDGLDNDADGLVDESGEKFSEVMTLQTGNNKIPYPWVRVQYRLSSTNQVVLYGDHDLNAGTPPQPNVVRGYPIIRVSSEGNQGSSQRSILVEAVRTQFNAPSAAIYSESDNFKFNGVAFLVSGKDWDPVTDTVVGGSSEVSGIATTGNPALIAAEAAGNQTNNVEGSGAEPSVATSPVNYDLRALIDQYKVDADVVTTGTSDYWGGINDYKIVYVTGDIHVTGQKVGGGILLIEGDFEVTGQFTWYGVVINMGNIRFAGGGSGTHIFGAMMTQGGVSAQQTVGGQADIKYSTAALGKLAAFNPYRTMAWTELP